MIGQDKLADERKKRMFAEYADDRVDERRCAERDHAEQRKLVYEDYMRRIGAHVPRRRSKRGQRRAAAKRWWIK